MYLIRYFCHRADLDMGAHGFSIELFPAFREAVATCGMTQDHVNRLIERCGRAWLDAAGYGEQFNGRPLYEPRHAIRVHWGEWGPEHITVPGNACGLDIDRDHSYGCVVRGARLLHPHNVDSWRQKHLMTIVFTEIAENVVVFEKNPLKPIEAAAG